MPGFDAISHGFSTVATGGMANHDNSFAGFSPAAQWVATVFMLLGAMSFSRFVQFARGEPQALFRDSQIRAFLAIYLCLAAGLLVARLARSARRSAIGTLREVLFNLASVITTTGFASTDYSLWGPLAETIFFCAMMICGCSGSTAGGPEGLPLPAPPRRGLTARSAGCTARTPSSPRASRASPSPTT